MSNENALKVRAKILGITPDRLATLQGLGLTPEEAEPLSKYTDGDLKEFSEMGLPGEEIVRRLEQLNVYDLRVYASVRRQMSEAEIEVSGVTVARLHEGFKRYLTLEEIVWSHEHGVSAYSFTEAKMAGVSREELDSVLQCTWATMGLDQYLRGRRAGYPAAELQEAAERLTSAYGAFALYVARRDAGDDPEQLLWFVRGNAKWLEQYVKYRDMFPDLEFDKLKKLFVNGIINPDSYQRAIRLATFDEIIEVAQADMPLSDYLEIRQGQARVKHHEIVELGVLRQKGVHISITTYIRMLDGGMTFQQIDDLIGKDMPVYEIEYLREERYGLDLEQLRQVKRSPLSGKDYRELRNAGLDHDTIITEAEATLFPSENVDVDLQD